MKLTLYNAISIDGFLASKDGNSEWVSEADFPYFEKAMKEKGCIIVGKSTFLQFENDLYPVQDVLNVVLTSNPDSIKKYDNVLALNLTPSEILNAISEKGYKEALLVGGGITNASFLKAGLIDELILSIHPLILGGGIKLFSSDFETQLKLEKLEEKDIGEGVLQVRYYNVK